MTFLPFERVGVIGLGLMGSSLARAIRHFGLAKEVIGYDSSPPHLDRAQALELTDHVTKTAREAVLNADCVILCVPVGAIRTCFLEIKEQLAPGAIVTDVGSVKGSIVRDLAPLIPPGVQVIPGHPIAGTEHSGPDAGFADLFVDRWCILTPFPQTPLEPLSRLSAFWRACGSKVEIMSPEHHDLALAITSHLPHLIAFNIVTTASDLEHVTHSEIIKYSAGGFRDFTRIAASDPIMWRDVFLNNKEAVLEMLGRFSEDLSRLQRAIRWGDGAALEHVFERARTIRQGIIEAGQDTSQADFGRPHGS